MRIRLPQSYRQPLQLRFVARAFTKAFWRYAALQNSITSKVAIASMLWKALQYQDSERAVERFSGSFFKSWNRSPECLALKDLLEQRSISGSVRKLIG